MAHVKRVALCYELQQHVERMTEDELEVVTMIVRRLMETGRAQYGPLRLTTDRRNFLTRALEEQVDAQVYLACALVRLRQERTRG